MRRRVYDEQTFKTVTLKGVQYKLYYIGVLAKRLNRNPATIRNWEKAGIIPKSEFKDKMGKRLYTEEQIEAIAFCARRNRINVGRSFALTNFSVHCHRQFAKLHEKYFGGEKDA